MKITRRQLKKLINEVIQNYYMDIGLKDNQPTDDKRLIKKTYRQSALKHHPDRGGDEEKFKIVSNAYSVLSDDQQKLRYDQQLYRHALQSKNLQPDDQQNYCADTGVALDDASMKKFAKIANIQDASPSRPPPRRPPPRNQNPADFDFNAAMNDFKQKQEEQQKFYDKQSALMKRFQDIIMMHIKSNKMKTAANFMGYMEQVSKAKSYSEIKDFYEHFME
jgi:curved DNA-binding protein CbpA